MAKQTRSTRFPPAFLATAMLAFSVLMFEISLTRIFSVMLSYHYVFAVISFSLFGLGLGGFLRKTVKRFAESDLAGNASLFAIFVSGSVIVIILLPVHESAFLSGAGFWVYIFLATTPFIFAGATLAGLFHRHAARSSILYGADLLGATAGAASVVWALNQFGPMQTVFFASLTAGAGALLLVFSENSTLKWRSYAIPFSSFLFIAIGWLTFEGEVKVGKNPDKDMYRMLANPLDQAKIIESRWSAFGRTDLVKSALPPDDMTIFVDGSAGSPMYNLRSIFTDSSQKAHLTRTFGAYFPFYFLKENEKNDALIIGSGGGRDVVFALLGGVEKITAVEVNPEVVEIVRDYAAFNGGIYTDHPKIETVIAEGRNYLRSRKKRYDIIMLAIPVTKSSRGVEGYALTENYIFTLESMHDYLDHLTPEGRIILVTHSAPEIYRLISLALTAFAERGVSQPEAMQHLYTMASGKLPTLVIKKTPFQIDGIRARYKKLHELGQDSRFFIPFTEHVLAKLDKRQSNDILRRKLDQVLFRIAGGKLRFEQVIESAKIDLSPVTDDSPFFFKFETGLPQPFRLFAFFIVSAFCVIAWIVSMKPPLKKSTRKWRQKLALNPPQKALLLIFFGLGMGFMVVEIALFQKLTFFLGDPMLALTILLVSLLLGTGLGSFASAAIKKRLEIGVAAPALITLLLTLVYTLFLGDIFNAGFPPKATAMTILPPLGFVMGFPFPLSIRLLQKHHMTHATPVMWGVNGIASVLGSALTMIIGLQAGFSFALWVGALLYAIVAAIALYLRKRSDF